MTSSRSQKRSCRGVSISDNDLDEGEQGIENNPNPMLNPVILTRLFEVCDLQDLRRFRQVSHFWRNLSLQPWREDMIVTLLAVEIPEIFNPRRNRRPPSRRKRLNVENVRILYESEIADKPYKKYSLDRWQFVNTMFDNESIGGRKAKLCASDQGKLIFGMGQFWKNCGVWIQSLHLNKPEILSAKTFQKVIFEMTPNLKILKFEGVRCPPSLVVDDGKDGEEIDEHFYVNPNLKTLEITLSKSPLPFSWRKLFLHFPNVEEFELTGNYWEEVVSELVDDLENLSKSKKHKLKIKCLDIKFLYCERSIVLGRLLELPQLKLETLRINLSHDTDVTLLPRALTRHGSTLKNMFLFNMEFPTYEDPSSAYPKFPFEFPLNNLTRLDLEGNITENLDFLRYTPNLQYFYFNLMEMEKTIDDKNLEKLEGLTLPHIRTFRVGSTYGHDEFQLCEEKLKAFTKIMPNVRVLECPLTVNAFRHVCTHWKELVELDFYSYPLGNEGLTGIVEGEEKRQPNITDLKYLRKLRVVSHSLTDGAIYDGFLKLSYLHSLTVTVTQETTNEAFAALCARFPSTSVTRSESNLRERKEVDADLKAKAEIWYKDYGCS